MTVSVSVQDGRIGLIAGNGRFPIIFADNARKMGLQVSAVAHEGETEPELEQHVDWIHWIKIGQLNKLIKAFKGDGVRQVVMLGGHQEDPCIQHGAARFSSAGAGDACGPVEG